MRYYYCYIPLWYEPGLKEIINPKKLYHSIQEVYASADEILNDERTIHDPQIVKIAVPDHITLIPTQMNTGVFPIVEATPLDWKKICETGTKQSTAPAATLFKPALVHVRSQLSEQFFNGHEAISFSNKKFRSRYQIVDRHLENFDQPLASIGSDRLREVCLLDPASETISKLVKDLTFKISISATQSSLDRIQLLMQFVHFILPATSMREAVSKVNILNEKWLAEHAEDENAYVSVSNEKGQHIVPVVPIDYYISQKTVLCRHLALLTAFLLQQLIKQHFLSGRVYHHRDNILAGVHSFVIFKDLFNQVYVLDPMLSNQPFLLGSREFNVTLLPHYGLPALNHMKERYLEANNPRHGYGMHSGY